MFVFTLKERVIISRYFVRNLSLHERYFLKQICFCYPRVLLWHMHHLVCFNVYVNFIRLNCVVSSFHWNELLIPLE